MLGTIRFSSKIKYGKNKRNLPYYIFNPIDNNEFEKLIVASKLGKNTKIDHYAIVDLHDQNCKPCKGVIKKILGPVNDYMSGINFILFKNNILPRKQLQVNLNDDLVDRLDLTKMNTISIDPETTQDIDDAFHFNLIEDKLELGIHITDLSDIQINEEYLNKITNYSQTVYTKIKNYNLFEELFCCDIGSLVKDKERNCISLIINFDNKISYKFIKTKIINKNKFSYKKADNMMKYNIN